MKKLLIVFPALILILGGLFIWKGGHHAVFLASAMEDWLDDDSSSQNLELDFNGFTLSGDAFWTEYHDRTVYGLEASGYGAYLHQGVLYLDTGRAYSLPPVTPDWTVLRKLLAGAVIHGRIVKEDGIYHFTMKTEELTLQAELTAGEELEALSFKASGEGLDLGCQIKQKPDAAHPLPQPVLDAMVRAEMEPPISITEPMEVLVPALESLLPLQADVTLGVECGILTLTETVALNVDETGAYLTRNGEKLLLSLPEGMKIDPAPAALAVLRNGEFTRDGDRSELHMTLPSDATAELVCQLVPQAADLGVTFAESEAVLIFSAGKLTEAAITAEGSLPFLVTTIPLSFSAKFDIT